MSGLADAFAGLQAPAKPNGAAVPRRVSAQVPRSAEVPKALPFQNTAKSRHPEFEAVKVYVRKNTHKLARRKFEDTGDGGDFSDLVEMLLQQYLGA